MVGRRFALGTLTAGEMSEDWFDKQESRCCGAAFHCKQQWKYNENTVARSVARKDAAAATD